MRGVVLPGDCRVEILDFKTGTPPSARQVMLGFAPQLALEAAMVRGGAFDERFAGLSIARVFWVALNAVERGQPIKNAIEEGLTADQVADLAMDRFTALVAAEYLGATEGIGIYIRSSQEGYQIPAMYSGIVVLGIIGVTLNLVLAGVEKRITAWQLGLTSK